MPEYIRKEIMLMQDKSYELSRAVETFKNRYQKALSDAEENIDPETHQLLNQLGITIKLFLMM